MKRFKWIPGLLALLVCMVLLCANALAVQKTITVDASQYDVTESGEYSTLEEVAIYLSLYRALPDNYLSKQTAGQAGWNNRQGNLWKVAPGKSIGGDRYGNYERQLPDAQGRMWKECDIGFTGGYRNGQRIVFSNDGLIYYTGDHYQTFQKLQVINLPDGTTSPPAEKDSRKKPK